MFVIFWKFLFLQHGAVVMLYHPCAYPSQVDRLREIVTGCIGKHIITPSTLVDPERVNIIKVS